MDDFSNHPVSITEAKADRTPGGADIWTARDVLISVLRKIDSGELKPSEIAIIISTDKEGTTSFDYFQKCNSTLSLLGLYQRAILDRA